MIPPALAEPILIPIFSPHHCSGNRRVAGAYREVGSPALPASGPIPDSRFIDDARGPGDHSNAPHLPPSWFWGEPVKGEGAP